MVKQALWVFSLHLLYLHLRHWGSIKRTVGFPISQCYKPHNYFVIVVTTLTGVVNLVGDWPAISWDEMDWTNPIGDPVTSGAKHFTIAFDSYAMLCFNLALWVKWKLGCRHTNSAAKPVPPKVKNWRYWLEFKCDILSDSQTWRNPVQDTHQNRFKGSGTRLVEKQGKR